MEQGKGKKRESDETLLTGINVRTKAGKKRAILVLYGRKAGNISLLCKAVNISRKTFYRWLEEDLKFREAIEAEQESLIDSSESKLYEAIGNGGKEGVIATIFHLKTKGKRRGYVDTRESLTRGRTASRRTSSLTAPLPLRFSFTWRSSGADSRRLRRDARAR